MELLKQVNKARDSHDNHMFMMLIGQKFAADVFLRDQQLWQLVVKFFSFEADLALSLNNTVYLPDGDFNQISMVSTPGYCLLKNCLIEDIYKYLMLFRQINQIVLEENLPSL